MTSKSKHRLAGAQLMSKIMLKEKTPIKIIFTGDWAGFVVFAVRYSDLGLSHKVMSHPFFKSQSAVNFIGELLVRQNMDMFADRLLVKRNYHSLVKSRHRNFNLVNRAVFLTMRPEVMELHYRAPPDLGCL